MKTSPVDDVRDMYEATADSYAEMMDSEIKLPVYAEVLGRLQVRIANTAGAVVDTACGSGHMLSMYRERYEPSRELIGTDLSPRMVEITCKRLGPNVRVFTGDMRKLSEIESGSAAAVLNYFAIHHLDADGVQEALHEWHRILTPGGQLLVAAWEGTGPIDYGDAASILAVRYSGTELTSMAIKAGFEIGRCTTEPVEDFPLDAVYIEARK